VTSFSAWRNRPVVAAAAAAAGIVITVAGCSGSGSSSSAASSPAAPTPAAPSVPSAPASGSASPGATASMPPLAAATGQLTGTQLQSVLLPLPDFPAGFATPASGPVSSGGSLTTGPAKYNLTSVSCATFIEHIGTAGFGETAMVSSAAGAPGQAYDQVIYQFGTAPAATAFLSGIKALAGRCGSFPATANGQRGTFSLTAADRSDVGGHPSVELLQTGTLGASKLTLDTLYSASGVDVFAGANVVVGAAAPTQPTKESIVYELMKRQAAVAVLG
jgi:hypothetical protein